MTANFWEYESEETYRKKQADQFRRQAQVEAYRSLEPKQYGTPDSIAPTSTLLTKPLITPRDRGGQDSGGFFKGLDDVASSVFMGKVRQPWDVLRPLQRVMEAEQKYVARPIAKAVLSPLGKYENLPGIVRTGAEVLFDPLTYIGPAELLKVGRLAKIAPELKLGLPVAQSLFDSPGSRRLFQHVMTQGGLGLAAVGGAEAAKQVGLPSQVGSIAAIAGTNFGINRLKSNKGWRPSAPNEVAPGVYQHEDIPVYHGAKSEFDEPTAPIERGDKPHYEGLSLEDSVYYSLSPSVASSFAGINYTPTPSGGRVYPYFLKQGTWLWNPDYDPWPTASELHVAQDKVQALKDSWETSYAKMDNPQAFEGETPFMDMVTTHVGRSAALEWQDRLKAHGYQGVLSGNELALWDRSAIEHAFDPERFSAGRVGIVNPDDVRRDMEAASNKARQLDSSGPARYGEEQDLTNPPKPEEIDWEQQLADSIEAQTLEKKPRASWTSQDFIRAAELEKNREKYLKQAMPGRFPPIGGGAAGTSDKMQAIFDKFYSLPSKVQDLVNATSDIEVKDYELSRRKSWTVGARDKLGSFLESHDYTQNLADTLNKHGLRFHDTEATALINEAGRLGSLGDGYGASMADHAGYLLDQGNKKAILSTAYSKANGTIVNNQSLINQAKIAENDFGVELLNKDGSLSLSKVVNNPELFQLNPQQQALIDGLTAPMKLHQELETAFDIKGSGLLAHDQPLSEDGIIRRGMNSAQTFQRPMGELAGEKGFLPYPEAQAARIQQGYQAMANNWLNASIDGMGLTASDLVPKNIVDEINSNKKLVQHVKNLSDRIKGVAAGKGYSKPQFTPATPELESIIYDMNIAATELNPAVKARLFEMAQEKLDEVVRPAKDLIAKRASIIEEIKKGVGSKYREQNPVEIRGRYYPEDVGNQLSRFNEDTSPRGVTKSVIDINSMVRPIMATLDASFLGVQGLLALLSNPGPYMKALQTLVTNGYGDYENTIRSSGRLAAQLNDGVHWAARNDAGEFLFPRSLQKLPGIGRMATNTNSWFTQFGNVLRSELYNSVDWSNMTPAKRASLARSVNLMSGITSNDPTNFESAVLFAPRFFRSQLGLMADAITKHDLGPMGAARTLGVMMTSGALMTYMANEALGQPTDFNPESPNFMRVRLGNQDVSIFGTWDTLARAFTKFAASGDPTDGIEYLARAKASPVMSRVYDVLTDSTLDGHKLSWGSTGDILESAAREAAAFGPISVTSAIQDAGDIADPNTYLGTGISFIGTKATPISASEKNAIRRDELASSVFHKDSWDALEPYQQAQLHKDYNIELPAKSQIAKAFEFRRAISERFQAQQEAVDKSLPIGKDWIDAYHNLIRERIGSFGEWMAEHPDAAAKVRKSRPSNANEAALQKFYSIFDDADKEQWSPDELTNNITAFQDKLSDAQQAYIDRNTGLHDTARVKEYKAAQKVLRPYWNIEDDVYDRLKGRLPNSESADSLQEYTNNLISSLQGRGVPDSIIARQIKNNRVLSEIQRATDQLRERYRRSHRDADLLLQRWYGYSRAA